MNICFSNLPIQIPNKKSRLILPSIPSAKKMKIIEKGTETSISPAASNDKLSKQNDFDEKINKIKDELIKFRKLKENEESEEIISYRECLLIFDRIMYLIKI